MYRLDRQRRLQALHTKQFRVVLRQSSCYGFRPWQLFGVDLQVARGSPDIGAGAGSTAVRISDLGKAETPLPL